MKQRLISIFTVITMLILFIGAAPMAAAPETTADAPIKLGDYLQLGEYNGTPVLWRCVAFERITGTDDNGNPIMDSTDTVTEYKNGYLPLMLADESICEKEFDAAGSASGSHSRGNDRDRFGSPYWADSNIRDWLNSSESDVVYTCGNAPSYKDEAGFLTNFTDIQKDVIKTVTQKTLLDKYDYDEIPEDKKSGSVKMPNYKYNLSEVLPSYKDAYSELITDKMFLLDVQQLQNVKNNYDEYFRLSSHYWIKSYTTGITVYPPQKVSQDDIYYESPRTVVGVRPAFYLNPESESLCGSSLASDAIHIMDYHKKISATPKKDGTKEHWSCIGCGKKTCDKNGMIEIADITIPAATQLCETIQLGEYVQMGTYDKNGDGIAEPILWRCVAFDKIKGTDSDGNPIMDSTDTVTEYKNGYLPLILKDESIKKEFDAAGSNTNGSHGRGNSRDTYGSSYWADSNIRDWLNSSATAGNMVWTCGNAPSYKDEAGFLTNFSQSEQDVMKTVTQKSILTKEDYNALPANKKSGSKQLIYTNTSIDESVQNYSTAYSEQVTDTIFLLDVRQGKNIYDNLGEYYYKNHTLGVGSYLTYWLRTPDTRETNSTTENNLRSYCVRMVNSSSLGTTIENRRVNATSVFVRPAFYLNPSAEIVCGTGTVENPYTFIEHTLTYHESHAATCTEAGNNEYWTCDSNDRIYADEHAENELNKIPEIAAGHNWNKWTVSENTAIRTCARDSSHTENQDVKISDIDTQIYTGNAIEPTITVSVGDIVLIKDTDYTVEYRNNINAGTADAIITCKGGYIGEITKTFTIEEAPLPPTPTSAPAYPYEITDITAYSIDTGNPANNIPLGEDFLLYIDIRKNSEYSGNNCFIAALYDTQGSLTGVYTVNTESQGDILRYSETIPAQKKTVGSIKAFIWDRVDSMKPLAEAKTLFFRTYS